jgi:hypothetical protein
MRVWQNTLLYILLTWTVLQHILSYLPLMRVLMDGSSYSWGEPWFGTMFQSSGLEGDWWLLVIRLVIGVAIIVLGTRYAARGLFLPLLLLWQGVAFANMAFIGLTADGPNYFTGDTLGVKFDINVIFPVMFGLHFALTLLWAWGERSSQIDRQMPRWTLANTVLFVLWLATLPVAYYLLSTGEPHGTTDQYGVLVTIGGWLIFFLAMLPFGKPRTT